jgi:hypothetical protein
LRSPPDSLPTFLLLVAALEIECADIGAALHGALAEFQNVVAARDFLPHILSWIECVARLVDITDHHGLADANVPASGFSCPVIMRNNVVLPAPLGPITPTMPPAAIELHVSNSSRSP